MLTDVIGAACNSLQEQLGAQLAEIQEEVSALCDRHDVTEKDVHQVRRNLARLMRERANDRRSTANLVARVSELDRRTAVKS